MPKAAEHLATVEPDYKCGGGLILRASRQAVRSEHTKLATGSILMIIHPAHLLQARR